MSEWFIDGRWQKADALTQIRRCANLKRLDAVALARHTGLPARAARAVLSGFGTAVPQRHLDQATRALSL
ncbi:hypothetical protein [Azospirillum sp.]|uniref:hypothetical protein n=1 Tax=Azospirillum sp. TaxID=34012 RepID=UPI003D7491C2